MVVRGAPAIGVSAAYGIALGLLDSNTKNMDELKTHFDHVATVMAKTRPTAVNLFWAIDRMKKKFYSLCENTNDVNSVVKSMVEEAVNIYDEDVSTNMAIGENGKVVINDGMNILTHCNAGTLATADYGTALSVIRAAVAEGKKIHVYADETRPFLQGARLTMWELMKDNIDCTLISDNMSGYLMSKGKIDLVVVGADRIAANGDSANKIGTYSVAVLAKHHGIPMYFAAPLSTIDINCPDGSKIPIEERSIDEVRKVNGIFICPQNAKAFNPSFDVTPNDLITGIITNKGIVRAPFAKGIRTLIKGGVL
jgi:methylthioribose-1-phosphate isomerase